MLRMPIVFLILTLIPIVAAAQEECVIGAYWTPEGDPDISWSGWPDYYPPPIVELDVYYVIRVEDFVRGVAWKRTWEGIGLTLVGAVQHYDPLEQFLEVTENGFRMGLGDCQAGFGGKRILVLKETLFFEWDYGKDWLDVYDVGRLYLGPNVLEDPEYAVYADCSDAATKKPCSFADPARIVEAKDAQSWGAIKATYR